LGGEKDVKDKLINFKREPPKPGRFFYFRSSDFRLEQENKLVEPKGRECRGLLALGSLFLKKKGGEKVALAKEVDPSQNGEVRQIGPEGVDEFGNPCKWTGFDKTGEKVIFWGKPKETVKPAKNAKRTVF